MAYPDDLPTAYRLAVNYIPSNTKAMIATERNVLATSKHQNQKKKKAHNHPTTSNRRPPSPSSNHRIQKRLAFESYPSVYQAVKNGSIANVSFTLRDVSNAENIYGPLEVGDSPHQPKRCNSHRQTQKDKQISIKISIDIDIFYCEQFSFGSKETVCGGPPCKRGEVFFQLEQGRH